MRRETTILTKPEQVKNRQWRLVNAEGQPLGRLAAEVAIVLMGKHRADYTPHIDTGDYVVVINGTKVALTGKKAEQRLKQHYTGYPGGLKAETYGAVRARKPESLIGDAVRRMLPKSRLGRVMLAKLKVYPGADHPHTSNGPVEMKV
ncbi:MAG: 50S ribosomal protein L13 [Phycisphaerales bacterium]